MEPAARGLTVVTIGKRRALWAWLPASVSILEGVVLLILPLASLEFHPVFPVYLPLRSVKLLLRFACKWLKRTYSNGFGNFWSAQCKVLPAGDPTRLFHPSTPRDYVDVHLFRPGHDLLEYPFLTLQFRPFGYHRIQEFNLLIN